MMRSMKKRILALTLLTLLVLPAFFGMLTVGASASANEVWVSTSGNDSNAGTSGAPLKTLDKAMAAVDNGGVINLSGSFALGKWDASEKTVTVKGGTLDFSGASEVQIKGNVTFACSLKFKDSSTIYANGYSVKIESGMSVSGTPSAIYGGGKSGSTVASTDLTLLSGQFYRIYGGSNGGTVSGDTYLHVGGDVNSNCAWTDHGETYMIFGGGNNDDIKGNTNIVIDGNVKANYAYGGSYGGSSKIGGATNMRYGGNAKMMSLYGGNQSSGTGKACNLIMTGGQCEQIFGASIGASMTADIHVKLLGGTVTRRVYGGCYNEWTLIFKSNNHVTGTITVAIGEALSLPFSYSGSDKAVYARSRSGNLSGEKSVQLFIGEAAKTKHSENMGYKDGFGGAGSVMSYKAVADAQYTVSYSASAGVLTETAEDHSATATINAPASAVYTGKAIEGATVTYSSGWLSGPVDILTYSNNINAGAATVSATLNGITFSKGFTIEKATVSSAPTVGKTDESIRGKNDGVLSGLNSDMEYGTDGISYSPVTSERMTVAPGTYYVRYAEKANYKPSSPATVTVGSGRMLKVTFVAEGSANIVREVVWNGTLGDIPAVPARSGYTEIAPYWDRNDFTGITGDITVNAVYTKDKAPQSAPILSARHESLKGKGDGGINGLTAAMEYRVGNGTYVAVTDPNMAFAPATYYVRYAGSSTKHPSPDTAVVISDGRPIKVTFVANGSTVAEREVVYGGSVTDLPQIPPKDGAVNSYWSVTALDNVRADITVEAVYTSKELQTAPTLTAINESIAGKGDGRISGLTAAMEYGADMLSFSAVVDPNMTLAAGTYYVRYAETDTKEASPAVMVTIERGRMLKVVFMADGVQVAVREVEYGADVEPLPEIPEKIGYTQTEPYWSVAEIVNVTEDMTVNAVYTADDAGDGQGGITPPPSTDTPNNGGAEEGDPSGEGNGTADNTGNTDKSETQKADSTDAPADGGCGSALMSGAALITLGTTVFMLKKKKED